MARLTKLLPWQDKRRLSSVVGPITASLEHIAPCFVNKQTLITLLGTGVTMYGAALSKGAYFTFNIVNGPGNNCSCYHDPGVPITYGVPLCSLDGLDASNTHTLVITQSDSVGLWVNLDFFMCVHQTHFRIVLT